MFKAHIGNCIDCPEGIQRMIVVKAGRCAEHNYKYKQSKKNKTAVVTTRRINNLRQASNTAMNIPDKTIQALIDLLDKLFSILIRKMSADENGVCICCTCRQPFHWKKIQCGHFMPRRHYIVRWDTLNTAPQCSGENCNSHSNGNQYLFADFIDEQYGAGTADDLRLKSKELFLLDKEWLKEQIHKTRDKLILLKHIN